MNCVALVCLAIYQCVNVYNPHSTLQHMDHIDQRAQKTQLLKIYNNKHDHGVTHSLEISYCFDLSWVDRQFKSRTVFYFRCLVQSRSFVAMCCHIIE